MKYIDAGRLKAEIEKGTPNKVVLLVYRDIILSLIDSLQQEQPDFPTTDEQIKEFLATHPEIKVPEKYKNPDWLFKKQEQSEAFDTVAFQKGVQEGRRLEREDAEHLRDVTKKISEDLEEAAEEYASRYDAWNDDQDIAEYAFKAGAEWQKRKMMDEAYEEEVQEVYRDDDGIHCCVSVGTDYKPGTIVYVITIPKEEEL